MIPMPEDFAISLSEVAATLEHENMRATAWLLRRAAAEITALRAEVARLKGTAALADTGRGDA